MRYSKWTHPISSKVLFLSLTMIFLNLFDAFSTLYNLEHGAVELNPLMVALLHRGEVWFVIGKYLMVSVAICGIASNGRQRAGEIALWVVFALYTAIAMWQCIMFGYIR